MNVEVNAARHVGYPVRTTTNNDIPYNGQPVVPSNQPRYTIDEFSTNTNSYSVYTNRNLTARPNSIFLGDILNNARILSELAAAIEPSLNTRNQPEISVSRNQPAIESGNNGFRPIIDRPVNEFTSNQPFNSNDGFFSPSRENLNGDDFWSRFNLPSPNEPPRPSAIYSSSRFIPATRDQPPRNIDFEPIDGDSPTAPPPRPPTIAPSTTTEAPNERPALIFSTINDSFINRPRDDDSRTSSRKPKNLRENDIGQDCLECICEANSKCDLNAQCTFTNQDEQCGPYLISRRYWERAGRPSGDFKKCVTEKDCAEETVRGFMSNDCNDGVVDCIDYAAIHELGAASCTDQSFLDSSYWLEFQQCYGFGR